MIKIMTRLVIVLLVVYLGVNMLELNKSQLSRDKQDEIVKIIVSNYYNIETIEFKDFVYDSKVGSYRILFKVNGYDNGLSFNKKEDIEKLPKTIGLNPVNIFEQYRKHDPKFNDMDLKRINIKYL